MDRKALASAMASVFTFCACVGTFAKSVGIETAGSCILGLFRQKQTQSSLTDAKNHRLLHNTLKALPFASGNWPAVLFQKHTNKRK